MPKKDVQYSVFAEKEADPKLERDKRAARGRIYAAQYLDMANKYFFHQHNEDASRCYRQALYNDPKLAFRFDILRRVFGLAVSENELDAGGLEHAALQLDVGVILLGEENSSHGCSEG